MGSFIGGDFLRLGVLGSFWDEVHDDVLQENILRLDSSEGKTCFAKEVVDLEEYFYFFFE